MRALTSSVSRSLVAPVLRSVSEPTRAVLPRPFPDLGSVILSCMFSALGEQAGLGVGLAQGPAQQDTLYRKGESSGR